MKKEQNKAEALKKKQDLYGNSLAGDPLKSSITSTEAQKDEEE